MDREHRLVRVGNAGEQLADGVTELLGNGIAHCVRDVDGGGAGIDHCLDDAAQEIQLGTARILTGKLHIPHMIAGMFYRRHRMLDHLIRRQAQLVLHMDRAGRQEGMNAPGFCPGQGFCRPVDIRRLGTGQGANGGFAHGVGNGLHRQKVPLAGDGEAGFDHIHLHPFQGLGDTQLLVLIHGGAGALLAIAQGGIENNQAFFAHRGLSLAGEPSSSPSCRNCAGRANDGGKFPATQLPTRSLFAMRAWLLR